jgi:hypothetical protein
LFNCARTVAPGLVEIVGGFKEEEGKTAGKRPVSPKSKIEDWPLAFEDWARLADVNDYHYKGEGSILGRPHQYVGKKKRSEGGGTKVVYPAAAFYRRVIAAAFVPAGDVIRLGKPDSTSTGAPDPPVQITAQPSEDAPYDIEAKKVVLNFRDKLGALMKYRGVKHAHLERKKPAIARKVKDLEGKVDKRGNRLRARTALYFINRACNNTRYADLVYLFRAILYCQARSGAAFIAHEQLGLGTGGEGGLGAIIASMMKDFQPAKNYLARQFKALERGARNTPKMDGVSPAYTSLACNWCARHGVSGELDDSASADHAICNTCGHIYDRHGSAADNIGDRFINTRFGKKKARRGKKREKGEPKEDKS